MDADKKEYISHEVLRQALIEQAQTIGLPKPEKEPTEEEKEKAKKLADPDGTGKITYENFTKLMKDGIASQRNGYNLNI
jgi:Ca2+-binding EF-hand superfamily protein